MAFKDLFRRPMAANFIARQPGLRATMKATGAPAWVLAQPVTGILDT
jgi:hypothetical protein